MTTFRFSLLAAVAFAALLVFMLGAKGSDANARDTAQAIAAQCGVSVAPARAPGTNQLGLAIAAVHNICPREGDSGKVACARKRISESHFPEVDDPVAPSCPVEERQS
jgi:hypothetical protein